MWGSTFAELAKKAQELQEHAKEQASHIHIASPGFFSLDALQGAETASEPNAALFATPQPSFHSSTHSETPQPQRTSTITTKEETDGALFGTPQPTSHPSNHSETPQPQQTSTITTKEAAELPWTTPAANERQQPSPVMLPSSPAVKEEELTQTETLLPSSAPAIKLWETEMPPKDGTLMMVESGDVNKSRVVVEDTVGGEAASSFRLAVPQDVSPPSEVEGTGWESDELDVPDDDDEETESLMFTESKFPHENNCMNHQEPPEATKLSAVEDAMEDNTRNVLPDMLVETDLLSGPKKTGWDEDDAFHTEDGKEESFKTTVGEVVNHDVVRESDLADQPVDFPGEVKKEPVDLIGQVEKEPSLDQVVSGEVNDEANVVLEAFDETEGTTSPDVESDIRKIHESIVSDDDERNLDVYSNDLGVNREQPKEDTPTESHVEPCVDAHESIGSENDEHDAFTSSNDHEVAPESTRQIESILETCVDKAHESIRSYNDEHVAVADFEMTPEPQEDMDHTHMANGDDFVDECHHLEGATDDFFNAPIAPCSPSQSSLFAQQEEFALELQRIKDAHQAEKTSLEQQHVNQLQEALASFNHDQCQAERQEMEERFMGVIRGHERRLQELMSENEGYQLEIGGLKKELAGKLALLEQQNSAMDSVNTSRNKNVETLEQKVKEMEEAASLAKSDADKVKEELQATKNELAVSNEAYVTLKARVKVVATELKERRAECRTLGVEVTELKETNVELETQITNLQSKVTDRERNHTEHDRQTKLLKEQMEKLEIDLNKTKHALKERDAIGEKALSAYKKKAQSALAVANARAAAANQAKEVAEMEATAARTLSDDAVQRARVAEASGNDALAEAKAYVRDMEKEKSVLEKRALEATEALKKSIAEAQHLNNSLEVSRATQEKLVQDVRLISHEREQERAHRGELEQQLAESQRSLDLLYEEVGTLREELRQAAAAAASTHAETDKDLWPHPGRTSSDSADRSDAEGTIAMLESELRDANRAIKELKDALKTAIAEQGSNGYGHSPEASSFAVNHQSAAASSGPTGSESMPLFFAMEKQAELSTAYDEINRLANLLGDAEFSKMEALEAMEDMKCQMDQAEARLKRFEKFGSGTNNPSSAVPVVAAPGRDANGNVNLEYLKNIMLSYLNAKSVAEKKALVPVISAVLCLTPQEQAAVFKNMEQSRGLESVGMALFDSLR